MATTNSTLPTGSKLRSAGSRDSTTPRRVSTTATTPTGTLTRNTLRQPSDSVSSPPTVGPTAVATLAMAVHRPMARALLVGSGKAADTSARDVTLTAAAATPWTPRATLSTSIDGASPEATDASVNTTSPSTYSRRRPVRSATVAADIMNTAMPTL